ncbi:Fc.00g003760.m01.CDS01 [Cosmosporella sp. VM-42]
MTSIGKFTAAALSNTNELTVAAAAFNIDFSLLKMDAPPEYSGIRDVLSTHRIKEAEDGQPHMIARRLGALFESLIPPIPHLIKAYGTRVSEISECLKDKNQYRPNTTLFEEFTGPNATSIWAAATSGKGALAIHFLGCMLARIWKGPEAISLWVEIVETRKQEITDGFQSSNVADLASFMASRQPFARTELSIWDASARSWLQTADDIKRLQHTQLTLIMNNLRMPVSSVSDPYRSIIGAWLSSLSAMEKIVQGIPHRVQDGAILLAMSSWHLYPDMELLVEQSKTVVQKDALTRGALITLSSSGVQGREGVYWSLPLSRLQYYSAPVPSKGRVSSETSRVTMKEFHISVLGILVSEFSARHSPTECCELLKLLRKRLNEKPHPPTDFDLNIIKQSINLLATAADTYLCALGTGDAHVQKLLELGLRRGRLRRRARSRPFIRVPPGMGFGLDLGSLISALPLSVESVRLCQDLACDMGKGNLYVKYYGSNPYEVDDIFVYAATHSRVEDPLMPGSDKSPLSQNRRHRYILCRPPRHDCTKGCSLLPFGKREGSPTSLDQSGSAPFENNRVLRNRYERDGACPACLDLDCRDRVVASDSDILCELLDASKMSVTMVYGDPTSLISLVALNKISEPETVDDINPSEELSASISILHSEVLRVPHLRSKIVRIWDMNKGLWISMTALAMADEFYKTLEGAKVSLSVLDMGIALADMPWAILVGQRRKERDTRFIHASYRVYCDSPTIFSCISMFESGDFSIPPQSLQNIIALSTGDSLYVVTSILSDPSISITPSQPEVIRVLGSLGGSEMAFLTVPASPMVRKFDIENWQVVNHRAFDGKLEDCFTDTSLHLSFTDYKAPFDIGDRGRRDAQAILLESVISVIDRGEHIGDIGSLDPINPLLFSEVSKPPEGDGTAKLRIHSTCSCKPAKKAAGECSNNSSRNTGVSLDCWDELLELPTRTGIFRAHGNWQARLAGALIGYQLGRRVLVLPHDACLGCLNAIDMMEWDVVIT